MHVLQKAVLVLDKQETDLSWVNPGVILKEKTEDEVPHRGDELDPGGPPPGHGKGQESTPFRIGFCLLKKGDEMVPDSDAVVQSLEGEDMGGGGGELAGIGYAPQGQDQVVIGQKPPVRVDHPLLQVNGLHLRLDEGEMSLAPQAADGVGDVTGLNAPRGYLMEKGGEEEKVLPAHQDDVHGLFSQGPFKVEGSIYPPEASPQDEDPARAQPSPPELLPQGLKAETGGKGGPQGGPQDFPVAIAPGEHPPHHPVVGPGARTAPLLPYQPGMGHEEAGGVLQPGVEGEQKAAIAIVPVEGLEEGQVVAGKGPRRGAAGGSPIRPP